ncbi:MAG: DUF2306 domain-containing protein [Sphingomonadaceae bacterium]|uniref:DUF2306 domain-containing protein n=1 Tax=Thermaurantiacus sp. TaxID=2820283 RepID=UPI00298EED9C|nr:DUF2306 domain-containing protein [Thermaurantiacus sp.]MCS6987674.1 DUF2306 domain-containing protein [Sphingomonadaceae bacterium]MDW8415275.1 DUF2306 domain-containing protein [Thermaurantiacus sp.]
MLADLPLLLKAHLAAALVALPVGFVQLCDRPGTARHRVLGWVYVAGMVVVLGTALGTLAWGRVSPFVPFAVLGALSLGLGLRDLVRFRRTRDPARLAGHRVNMGFSWLGLVMAGVSQVVVNPRFGVMPPDVSEEVFWASFAAVNLTLYAIGAYRLLAKSPQTRRAVGRAVEERQFNDRAAERLNSIPLNRLRSTPDRSRAA